MTSPYICPHGMVHGAMGKCPECKFPAVHDPCEHGNTSDACMQCVGKAHGEAAGRAAFAPLMKVLFPPDPQLFVDSGDGFLEQLQAIADEDVVGLKKAQLSYGNSWKSRGGVGALMMLARKWDRLENRLRKHAKQYDIFDGIANITDGEGLIDDVRDLRRYLMLVEAEMRARGFGRTHRDNAQEGAAGAGPATP